MFKKKSNVTVLAVQNIPPKERKTTTTCRNYESKTEVSEVEEVTLILYVHGGRLDVRTLEGKWSATDCKNWVNYLGR